ncbi:MAG: hypothetical protein LLG42_03120 [Chloroflexi bacterium]|nr:hypothetical protein [Chloroflexota bacterium]
METDLPIFSKIPEPLPQHYPAVYWFWHHIPSPQEIEEQLAEIKQAGYRTFLIQPRLAFPIHEYLGQGYLEAYRIAMQTAKTLGLTAGLYDDYNWISGHAGGRTVAGHDELRERQLFWSSAKSERGVAFCGISGIHNCMGDGLGNAFQDWIYEGGQAGWGDWQVVRAYACPEGTPAVDVTAHCRIIANGPGGCQVQVDSVGLVESGARIIVFISARCITARLVNLLHPDAADRFIEVGYEPYRRAVGDYFGSPLAFLFIDQPYTGFYTWKEHFGNPLNSLMFDESLVQIFREKHGYDLGQALLSLVQEENADTPRLRCDFFETYGDLARSRFLAPLAEWARGHGLKFAGHELLGFVGGWGFADGLQGIDVRVNLGADYFAIDEIKDISSVDACNYHPQISARFGASMARAHGRKGCMVEQYSVPVGRDYPAPAGQWHLTLAELRSQAIRHLLSGASTFLFHAFYQTSGSGYDAEPMRNPRFDFPPGINFEPWFHFHPRFAEELAGLNFFLEEVQPQPCIALLYPLRSFWHDGPSGSFNAESAFWNRWLSEHGFEYDIIDEGQVNAAELAQKGYRLLILPGVSVVRNEQFSCEVERFVENGGWLAASGKLPLATQEKGLDPALEQQFREWMESSPRTIYFAGSREEGYAKGDESLPAWMATLQDGITVQPLDGLSMTLVTRQGNTESGPAIALFNDADEERHVRLIVPQSEGVNLLPERWVPARGELQKWTYFEHTDGGLQTDLRLKPHEPACFRFKREAREDVREAGTELPHLCRLDGNAIVETAGLDENNRLQITLMCNQKGPLRLLVRSPEPPRTSAASFIKEIHRLGRDQWQIDLDIPHLPQPIVLREGWALRVPHEYKEKPADMQRGWEKDHPFYSGSGYYSVSFHLDQDALNYGWELQCPAVHTALSVYLNQVWVGACGWHPYHLLLPDNALKPAYNQLQIAVWNTAGNSFYRDTPYQRSSPFPSGLDEAPELHPFFRLRLTAQ